MLNWQSSPAFYIVPKYRAGSKHIQTPVPSAGQNPDWSIKATFHLTISMRANHATGKIQRKKLPSRELQAFSYGQNDVGVFDLQTRDASECQKNR